MIRRGRGGVSNVVQGDLSVGGNLLVVGGGESQFSGDLVLTGQFSKITEAYSPNPIAVLGGLSATKLFSVRTGLNVEKGYVDTSGNWVSLAGTNTTDVTLTAVGSVPNANGASVSGQALTLQPADSSNPGVVTTNAQTFVGKKTFNSGSVNAGVFNNPSNGGNFTPNCNSGNFFVLGAGAGVASYTINTPTNASTGQFITFMLTNISGGALAITWSAAFKMAAWVNPANNFVAGITFLYNGSSWYEMSRNTANIPT